MLTPRMKDAPRLKELFLSALEISFPKICLFRLFDWWYIQIFFVLLFAQKIVMIFTRIFFPAISMQILIMIVNNIIIVYLFKGHKK